MDASEIHARRLIAKEVITLRNFENFIFPIADGKVKLSGGDQENLHLNTGGEERERRIIRV